MDELERNKQLTSITLEVMMNFFASHDMKAMALVKGALKPDSEFMSINTGDNKIEESLLLFAEYIAREMNDAKDPVEAITVWCASFKSLYLIVEGMNEEERKVTDETIKAIMRGEI